MGRPAASRGASEIAALRLDLIAKKPERDRALAVIVERIRNSTRATAAAIALADGGEIVCRASSGNAPSVGTRVNPDSGLSGECVRTGEIVRCDDTESDPRTDRQVCRRLDLRSIVIVPVRIQGRPAGVLEVFSSQPNAFASSDERVLGQAADLVAEIAARPSEPAPPRSRRKVAARVKPQVAKPQLEEGISPSTKEALTPAIEEQPLSPPIAQQAKPADAAATPQPKSEPATVITAPPVAAVETPEATPTPTQSEVEPPAFIASIITTDRAEQLLRNTSARLAALARSVAHRWSPLRVKITAFGIVVTVLAAGGWQRWRAATPPKIAPVETQLQPSPAAANAPTRLLAATTTTAAAKSNVPPAQPKPVKRATTITLPPPDMDSSAAPPVIALVAHPGGEASPISNLLTAPVATPTLDPPKVSQLSGGKLIRKVEPFYPPSLALGTQGEVVLRATINRKGQVAKVSIMRGPAALARAAVAAVTRWRYEPFLLNGVPIEVENDIVLHFNAPAQ